MASDFVEVPRRVILHIDLDCFYCQVEQKRLNIPRDVPCAVQQWDGLIAVNYAARAHGVVRNMRTAEARKACPDLKLVHVQTIGEGGSEGAQARREGSAQMRSSGKACLQRYRLASGEILRLLISQLSPGTLVERASIDEVYIDATGMVEDELAAMLTRARPGAPGVSHGGGPGGILGLGLGPTPQLLCIADEVAKESHVLGGPLDPRADFDQRLILGAALALRLRRAVYDQLYFTCSAGVASNKLLAKIGSASHKPNKQSVMQPRCVAELMQGLPLGKIRGLGGKLGTALEQLGCSTADQVAALPWETLVRHFDDRARWISQVVRGVCTDPVTPKDKVKSLNSCKSFDATSDLGTIQRWVGLLAEELAQRVADDEADNRRRPRTLVLHYRARGSQKTASGERSVRCSLPPYGKEGPLAGPIAAAAMNMFSRLTDALPCVRLALAATDFSDQPADNAKAITKFFGPAAKRPRALAQEDGQQQVQQGQGQQVQEQKERDATNSRGALPAVGALGPQAEGSHHGAAMCPGYCPAAVLLPELQGHELGELQPRQHELGQQDEACVGGYGLDMDGREVRVEGSWKETAAAREECGKNCDSGDGGQLDAQSGPGSVLVETSLLDSTKAYGAAGACTTAVSAAGEQLGGCLTHEMPSFAAKGVDEAVDMGPASEQRPCSADAGNGLSDVVRQPNQWHQHQQDHLHPVAGPARPLPCQPSSAVLPQPQHLEMEADQTPDPAVLGVDIEEQRRILHDIEIQKLLSRVRGTSKPTTSKLPSAGGRGRPSAASKQKTISSLFLKPQ